jgi:hypothetical protein
MVAVSKLPVKTGLPAAHLAQEMFGTGVKVVSATDRDDPLSAGVYGNATKVAHGVAPSDSGVILSTGRAFDTTNTGGAANQTASKSSNNRGLDDDADLNAIAGAPTFDAVNLRAEFLPTGSVMTMQITSSFGDHLEHVGSGFNDAVGDGDISISNLSPWTNGEFYVENAQDQYNTEMDGFTVTLTLKAPVNPGRVNAIKIGADDGGDASCDSNLTIAADSVQTAVVASEDRFDIARGEEMTVDLVGSDADATGGTLNITKINGQPVAVGSVVTLSSGLQIIAIADGTITVANDGDEAQGPASSSYEVANGHGLTDVDFGMGNCACFAAGSLVDTLRGPVAVEAIRPGDMVLTRDNGYRPVRWSGRRTVPSAGRLAPVVVPAGLFGGDAELRVPPQHRLLLTGWRAELHCGEHEVLAKAIHLVRCGLLRQDRSSRPVTYCHLMFDRHEIIRANGVWSESCHPGPQMLRGLDRDARDELALLFPELFRDAPAKAWPLARAEAPGHISGLLVAADAPSVSRLSRAEAR